MDFVDFRLLANNKVIIFENAGIYTKNYSCCKWTDNSSLRKLKMWQLYNSTNRIIRHIMLGALRCRIIRFQLYLRCHRHTLDVRIGVFIITNGCRCELGQCVFVLSVIIVAFARSICLIQISPLWRHTFQCQVHVGSTNTRVQYCNKSLSSVTSPQFNGMKPCTYMFESILVNFRIYIHCVIVLL
jgi:hypothetical protein